MQSRWQRIVNNLEDAFVIADAYTHQDDSTSEEEYRDELDVKDELEILLHKTQQLLNSIREGE